MMKLRRLCALVLCLAVLLPGTALFSHAATQGTVTKGSVRVRTGPGTNYAEVKHNGGTIYLNAGHSVTITGDMSAADGGGYRWYPVSFQYSGSTYSGYIREDLMSPVTPSQPAAVNGDYAAQRAAFPESYRPYLDALHNAHPSWSFEAVNTGFDWNYVQQQENVYRRNMTQSTKEGYRSQAEGCYNASTGQYIVLEGSNWYQASPALVAYYMDPRNFLNETDIFQFEKLSYDPNLQNAAGVASMLNGSFMAGKTIQDLNGNAVSYTDAFVTAGSTHNVSLYHLVARCIQEVGRSGNAVGTRGNYPGYEGIYNYFSIGASRGAVDGLAYAAKTDSDSYRPWNTPYKAIMGGAKFLSSSYISCGQDTLYLQKFNVTTNRSFYHQYMANVAAPNSEGHTTRNGYVNLGLLDTSFTFRIPVYNNMPAYACLLPGQVDSNNADLKSLSLAGYALTPAFSSTCYSYSLVLPEPIESIQVNAVPVVYTATVSGDVGNVSLTVADINHLSVTCTSVSGNKKIYTIAVEVPSNEAGWDPMLFVSDGYISGISPGNTASQVKGDLNLSGTARAKVLNSSGNAVSDNDAVATGYILHYYVYNAESNADYLLVVFGDISPDGKIDAADVSALREILLEKVTPSDAVLAACDVDHDGKVGASDLLLLNKTVQGKATIDQFQYARRIG